MAPTLVLLHGFTHTGASWDPVVAALRERYRALAPDIRGHGTAAALRPITLEAVLRDVAELAPPPFTLAGYSMGGRIALHATLALAGRVDRLVLIGASPGIAQADERAARRAADDELADQLERSSIEELALGWANTPVLADQPPLVRERAHADRLRNTPRGLAQALRGLGTGALAPLWHRLGELHLPVTLIAGERDRKFRTIAEEMAQALPDGNVAIMPGAGHAAHLERPARCAEIIAAA